MENNLIFHSKQIYVIKKRINGLEPFLYIIGMSSCVCHYMSFQIPLALSKLVFSLIENQSSLIIFTVLYVISNAYLIYLKYIMLKITNT